MLSLRMFAVSVFCINIIQYFLRFFKFLSQWYVNQNIQRTRRGPHYLSEGTPESINWWPYLNKLTYHSNKNGTGGWDSNPRGAYAHEFWRLAPSAARRRPHMVERDIYIEASKTRWRAPPRYRARLYRSPWRKRQDSNLRRCYPRRLSKTVP